MHEMGIVDGILNAAVQTARGASASRVVAVTVRIGDMAEIVEDAMTFAWEVLREQDPLTCEAELRVETVAPRSVCIACGAEFDHDRYHVRCPVCGSAQTSAVRGRELELVSVEIETPDDDAAADDTPHDPPSAPVDPGHAWGTASAGTV